MLEIKLYKSEGFYEVDYKKLGIDFLEFTIEALEVNHEMLESQGNQGSYFGESKLNSRRIRTRVLYTQPTYKDFHENKSEVYKVFNPLNKLFFIDERQPNKKWEVKVDFISSLTNKEVRFADEIEIVFISESPFAQAIKKTEAIINSNQGFLFNEGDQKLDARDHEIKLKFHGESTNLRIVNETTNTQFQYFGNTKISDALELDSLYLYINNVLITDITKTNLGALEIAEGSNKIKIYGVKEPFSLKVLFNPLFI